MRNKYAHIEARGPEILEARIAPASLVASAVWKTGEAGEVFELKAGEGLSTAGDQAGAYLLYVEKGNALVFTTDFNNNGTLDENEITGIAAGDGLRLILFSDVHGDIVTNLRENTIAGNPVLTLSDSNNNAVDDPAALKGDGRVLLNRTIEKIELRTLTIDDLPDQNADGVVDDNDVNLRAAATSFSIFGNIYAGRGFGLASDPTSGLIINSSGALIYPKVLLGAAEVIPTIGSIKVGTAASGEWFSFGVSNADDTAGTLQRFTPQPGQKGADIAYVRSAVPETVFNLNSLKAGDGGAGAVGGDVVGVTLNADDSGGYEVIAGNGGRGATGGKGGSIIQFTDLGSHTGKVVFKSGSGGTGTTGAGGDAGDFLFETMNIYGFVNFELGDGGSGFTAGGAGASLLTGTFTQTITPYTAGEGVGTTHLPNTSAGYVARIGSGQEDPLAFDGAIDFDGDGYGDFVYTTVETSQLVVVFGGPITTQEAPGRQFRPERIYLSGARNAEAVTVGDLNRDGHPDIAVGSTDASNRGGIVVFLSKYEDLDNNGILDSSEDLDQDGKNDFLGFYEGRFSALPQLTGFDPDRDVSRAPYTQDVNMYAERERLHNAQPVAVGDIAAGDFDGDGRPELAVTANYGGWEVLLFLTADIEEDDLTQRSHYTGQFYADYGTKRVETPGGTTAPDPRKPYLTLFQGDAGHAIIEATALSYAAENDVILVSTNSNTAGDEANWVQTINYVNRQSTLVDGKYVAQAPVDGGFFSLGEVDTNREVGLTNMTFAFPRDFAVVDYDEDGFADVIAIIGNPESYMVGSRGDGSGDGLPTSGIGDQAGYSFENIGNPARIRAVDGDGDGTIDDVAVFGSFVPAGYLFEFVEGSGNRSTVKLAFGGEDLIAGGRNLADIWYPNAASPGTPVLTFAEGTSNLNLRSVQATLPLPAPDYNIPNAQPGFRIFAGDGGNSVVGNGGAGGGIGSGSKLQSFTSFDPITGEEVSSADLAGSVQLQINGVIDLIGGKGGDGFAKGGKGGGIIGVVSRGEANVSLTAGDGGRGVSAVGGDGGSLASNSIRGGYSFIAGDGGVGFTGGKGGSVIGNGNPLTTGNFVKDTILPGGDNDPDDPTDDLTYIRSLTVLAGQGGDGTRGGGLGGSILSFRSDLNSSFLRMEAGHGGNSVAGTGGVGGSIKGSSPTIGSIISSDIALIAGDGGGGQKGGAGGSVSSFIFKPPATGDNVRPTLLSVIGGHGGAGISGNGGRGGDVSGIDVPTKGAVNSPTLEPYNFNRMLAGHGGASAGGSGGAGGDVTNIKTTVGQAAYALIGGAGGHGLTAGGKGGSVLNAKVEVGGSTIGKVLAVAGAGGDASAFVENPNDRVPLAEQKQKMFGGRVGQGGNGGDIVNFRQGGNILAHVDLIAGNGGSSLNYGTANDRVPFAGRGGSIKTVFLAGDAGNIDPSVAIKSYNDIRGEIIPGGESMAAWVENNIRNNPLATTNAPIALSDSTGNVGVVVGAAGRIKTVFDPNTGQFISQPATFPKRDGNGDLIDFTAGNLLSAVAGNVERIAVIHAARGVVVTKGTVGADKPVLGQFDYLDKAGNPVTAPVRDGRLVDGALVASEITDLFGNPTTLIGRVFKL